MTATGWIGEATKVTVSPNTTDKFVGYAYNSTVGELEYTVAANNPTDTNTHIVKVYYVKDATQTKELTYNVEYYKDDALTDTDTIVEKVWINSTQTTITINPSDINLVDKFGSKFALDYTNPETIPTTIEDKGIIKVYYATDVVGEFEEIPEDPEKPGDGPIIEEIGDGTPDKYQIKVTYVAVNGKVNIEDPFYLTLTKGGKWATAEDGGIALLPETKVATGTPNDGYQGGTWKNGYKPEAGMTLTEDTEFVIEFSPVPVIPAEVEPEPTPSPRPFVPNPIVTPDVEPTETPEVTPTPTTTPEVIVEPETPQAARDNSWALLNLICSAGTVLLGLFLLISKTKKEEEEDEDEQKGFANEDDEANHYKRNKLYRLLGVITSVASVLVFIFTEDMRAKMVIIDRWTLLMVVLLFVNVVTFYLGRRWQEDEDEEEVQQ